MGIREATRSSSRTIERASQQGRRCHAAPFALGNVEDEDLPQMRKVPRQRRAPRGSAKFSFLIELEEALSNEVGSYLGKVAAIADPIAAIVALRSVMDA
jgi:hypothetical protein